VLIVVFAFIGSVTWWLAEQYAGGVAANYIISPLTGFLVSSYQWGKEHPGQISMTIFFLTCAYLVIRVIQDIRPVRAIPVTVEYQSAKWGVIKISNHTGDDLFNWTVHVVGLDDAELQSRHLNWFHEGQERDIQNGKSGLIYLQDIRPSLITGRDQEGKPLFDGKVHDVELFFRGNTR
jgi:hypothetical protein